MKYPILYAKNETDFFSLGLGVMTNTIEATVTEERNGSFYFESKVIIDDKIYPQIENDMLIRVDAGHTLTDQRFRIKRIVDNHDGTASLYAEHISYLTSELSLKPDVSISGSAESALQMWKSSITDTNPFVVDSDISTNNTASWRIDKVQNARQALGGVAGSILDVWGGEYCFDNYHISLLSKRGTTANVLLAYGRNITDFEQERNIEDTYNAVYPYALYTDDKQKEHLVTLDEYYVDAENIGNYPNRKALPVDFSSEFESEETPTKAKLKSLAQQYIVSNDIGVPSVSITLSFLDLSKTSDYADLVPFEELNLCDDVRVIYPKLGVNTIAKVVRTVWNVLNESYNEIEIGQKRASLSDKISEQAAAIKEIETQANGALISANGKNTNFYGLYGEDGLSEPQAIKIGDLWYKPNGNETEMYQWDGTVWKLVISTAGIKEAQDAAANAEMVGAAAQVVADNAKAIGEQAQKDADAAQATADNAKAIGEAAQAEAERAASVGDAAQVTADAAKITGENAQKAAEAAKLVGENAQKAADNAKAIGEAAQATANEAATKGDNAKVVADAAQADLDAAKVDLDKAKADLVQNQKDIDSNQSYIDSVHEQAQQALTNTQNNATAIENIQIDTSQLKTDAEEIRKDAEQIRLDMQEATSTLNSDVTRLTESQNGITQKIDEQSLAITNVVKKADDNETKLAAQEQTVEGFKQTVAQTYATQQSVASQIEQKANSITQTVSEKYADKNYVASQINQKAGEITSTVSSTYTTKSDFNTGINNAATDATTKANNALASAKSDATNKADAAKKNAVTESKTYTDAQLKITADSITSTVSATYETKTNVATNLNTAKSYADTQANNALASAKTDATNKANDAKNQAVSLAKTETTSQVKQLSDSITSTVSKVEEKVDGIKVGGRNLLIKSTATKNTYLTDTGGLTSSGAGLWTTDFISCEPNESFSFKDYSNATIGGQIRLVEYDKDKNFIKYTMFGFDTFRQFGVTENAYYIRFSCANYEKSKLEKGDKATDWTPAPEDVDANIDSALTTSKEYTNSQITQKAGEITASVSATYETKTNVANNLNTAKSYADTQANNAKTSAINTASTDANTKANAAKTDAINTASTDATNKANKALADAKTYSDAQLKITSDSITSTISKMTGAGNLVAKSTFEDGQKGNWTSGSLDSTIYKPDDTPSKMSRLLQWSTRDNYEDQWFDIKAGETYYFEAYLSAYSANYPVRFGMHMMTADGTNEWQLRASVPKGAGLQLVSGEYTVPSISKMIKARPFLQIDGSSNFGLAKAVGMRIENVTVAYSKIQQTAESIKSTVSANYTTQNDFDSLKNKTDWRVLYSVQDLNNLTTTGKYWLQVASNSNAPTTSWIYVTVDAPNSNRIKQTVQQDSSVSGYWERTYNGSWSGWRKMSDESWVSSQITQTAESINSTVSQKVGKSEVISTINQSAEAIRLNAKWIWLSGTSLIDDGVIKTAHIADGQITNAKIGSLAVTSAKIADAQIITAKIADLAVTDAKISSLTANKLTAGTIDASIITVKNLNASNMTTGTLDASKVTVANIDAWNITTGNLDATKITVSDFNADWITVGSIDAAKITVWNLNASNMTTGTLDASKITVKNLSASVIITGTLDASKVIVANIDASKVTTGTMTANRISGGTIDANNVTINNLNAWNITTGTLDASKVTVANIDASKITTGTLSADKINGGTINGGNVNLINLNANNISSGKLSAIDITGSTITGSTFETTYNSDWSGRLQIIGATIRGYMGSLEKSRYYPNAVEYYTHDNNGGWENTFRLDPKGITNVNVGYGTRTLAFFSEGLAIAAGSSNTGVTKNSGIRLLGSTSYIDLFSDKSSSGSDYSTRLIAESGGNGGINNNKGQFYINANSIALNTGVGIAGTLTMNGNNVIGAGNIVGTTGSGGWTVNMINIQGITGTPYLNVTSGGSSWGVTMWKSDMRLKKNIQKTTGKAIDIVDKLMVRQFDWRDSDRHTDYGLIAQNVERVLPQAVFEVEQKDRESIKQLSPEGLIPVLVQAIQELKKEIRELKS